MSKIEIRIFLDRAEITESKFRNCPRTTTSAPTTTPVLTPAPLAATEDRPVAMWQWIAIGLGCALIIIIIVIIIRFSPHPHPSPSPSNVSGTGYSQSEPLRTDDTVNP